MSEYLPEQTSDDKEIGWGDDIDAAEAEHRDDDWFREQRPPHHGG